MLDEAPVRPGPAACGRVFGHTARHADNNQIQIREEVEALRAGTGGDMDFGEVRISPERKEQMSDLART